MGTVFSLDLRGAGDHASAIGDVVAWLRDVNLRFSPFRHESEVSRLGRGELGGSDISIDLAQVLAVCEAVEARSNGAFSAWRSERFDPSAYVKGWSAGRAAGILRAYGCNDWSINAGGDVLVAGAPVAGGAWRIGVQHPTDRTALAGLLVANELAVATSGSYERGRHIRDPRTERAADEVASVTVCGPDLGLADAYSTAAFVLGEEGPAWISAIEGYESLTIRHDGRTTATAGFPRTVHGVPITAVTAAREPEVAA